MRNWYKRGDTKLKALIVSISRIFKKSRLTLDFDNINKPVSTMRETSITIYRELEKKNRSAFLDLGLLVYMEAYAEANPESKPDKYAAQEKIKELKQVTNDYVDDSLRRTEEAVAEALSEIRDSRSKFRALVNPQARNNSAIIEDV